MHWSEVWTEYHEHSPAVSSPQHSIAADIEKALLFISVSETDRDVLRFLWVDDVTEEEPRVITLHFTRVVFGDNIISGADTDVSSSPFLLNATAQHHIQKYSSSYPEVVEKITRSIYVDNIISGADCF